MVNGTAALAQVQPLHGLNRSDRFDSNCFRELGLCFNPPTEARGPTGSARQRSTGRRSNRSEFARVSGSLAPSIST
jgi:hypothetical protein